MACGASCSRWNSAAPRARLTEPIPTTPGFPVCCLYDEQVRNLVAGMQAIAGQFPLVQFAVPESEHIYQGRPAVWAFVADGLLNSEQREALGRALQVL